MKIEDIYAFYETPQPRFLNQEQAVCYILSILLQKKSYGSELIQELEESSYNFRISDPILYAALQFLEEEEFITSYWQKVQGRGRPRRMYELVDDVRGRARELAQLWETYIQRSVLDEHVKVQP